MKKAACLACAVVFLLFNSIRAHADTLTGTVVITSGGWDSYWPRGDDLDIRAPGFRAEFGTITYTFEPVVAWPLGTTVAFDGGFRVRMNSIFDYCGTTDDGVPGSMGYYHGIQADCISSPNGISYSASLTVEEDSRQDYQGLLEAVGPFTAHGEIIGWSIGNGNPHGCAGCTKAFDVEIEGHGTARMTGFVGQTFHAFGLAFEPSSPTPEPQTLLLLGTGLLVLGLLVRRRLSRSHPNSST